MSDFSSSREESALHDLISDGVYVSLHTDDEGNTPDGGFEVDEADYGRQFVEEGLWSTSGEGPTTLQNDNRIDWGETENDWGTVTHAALWDSETGGAPETSTIEIDNAGSVPIGVEMFVDSGEFTIDLD